FTELSFTPSAPGTISAHATWSSDWFGPAISLKMEIRKPDGTLAKDGSGGNPLPVSYTLSDTEFQKFKGQAWKVIVRNNSSQNVTVSGTLKVTFPNSTVTVFNNSSSPMNLGSQGAETQVTFNTPNKAGQLVVDISFDDGIFHDLQFKDELLRPSGGNLVVSMTGHNSIQLTFNMVANGSPGQLGRE